MSCNPTSATVTGKRPDFDLLEREKVALWPAAPQHHEPGLRIIQLTNRPQRCRGRGTSLYLDLPRRRAIFKSRGGSDYVGVAFAGCMHDPARLADRRPSSRQLEAMFDLSQYKKTAVQGQPAVVGNCVEKSWSRPVTGQARTDLRAPAAATRSCSGRVRNPQRTGAQCKRYQAKSAMGCLTGRVLSSAILALGRRIGRRADLRCHVTSCPEGGFFQRGEIVFDSALIRGCKAMRELHWSR